jgi:DHA2 family multidrug resistance protein
MTRFNLSVDINMVMWSRVVMGFGMGMVFVPLTSMAFATIKKEEMSNATSIFSLLRNLAGSFGIAFMTTFLARRAQFHQFRFSERLNPFNAQYQAAVHKAMVVSGFKTGTASPMAANGMIYKQLMIQSNLFAFIDAFFFATVIMLCVLPIVFLLRTPKHAATDVIVH